MEMIESFQATSTTSDLLVLIDKDDPTMEQYMKNLPSWVMVRIYDRTNDKTYTTEIINRAFEEFNNYDYYSITNDDIVYITPGWDELATPLKITSWIEDNATKKYGADFIGNINPSTFPYVSIIDGDIARAVGWMQYPPLVHSAGDNIWYWIGRRTDILNVNEDYHYVHKSAYFDDGEADETFQRTNARNNKQDYYTYIEWLKYKCGTELIKVENLLKEKRSCQEEHQEQNNIQQIAQ